MNAVTDPAWLAQNDFGLRPDITRDGWDASLNKRPWADLPSVDETIAAGFGFVQTWATGIYPDGSKPIGNYAKIPGYPTPKTVCDMRGLDAVPEMERRWPGSAVALKSRTDECKRRNLTSGAYVAGVREGLIASSWTVAKRNGVLDGWLQWVLDAGFEWLMLDAAGADDQSAKKSNTMLLAERALARGLKVACEPGERVTPGFYPWFNGRFGCVSDVDALTNTRSGQSWYGPACIGVATEWFGWMNGAYAAEARVRRPAGMAVRCCVEFGGLPESSWKRAA